MAKHKEMDRLSRHAAAARAEGISYGQWIAKYRPPMPPAERFPKRKGDAEQRRCPVCDAPIRPESRARYCGRVCQAKAKEEREIQRSEERLKQLVQVTTQ